MRQFFAAVAVMMVLAGVCHAASFDKVYTYTLLPHEGGWVNNPVDRGKETYRGISRAFNPNWKGWAQVDAVRKPMGPQPKYDSKAYWVFVKELNKRLAVAPGLQQSCSDFYKGNYWDNYSIGDVASQALAEDLCDEIVNRGYGGGPPMLKAAFAEIEWAEAKEHPGFKVPVEPTYRKSTWAWLNSYTATRKNRKLVARAFEHYRNSWYLDYVLKHPSQREYALSYWGRSID